MKCPPQIFSLLAIHHWTALANKNGGHGTEGESLDIRCPYPDGYQNLPKYFCCEPCWYKNVLVKSKKSDSYTSSERFSLYDNSQGRTFTVTISRLRLQDAGIYYCGIDQWGTDKLQKIHLTVGKVKAPGTAPSISSPGTILNVTDSPRRGSTWTSGSILTDQAMTTATCSTTHLDGKKGHDDRHVVVGGVFGVLVCLSLAALAVRLRRRSVSQFLALKPAGITAPLDIVQDEEDAEHVYGEIMEYSAIGCHQEEDSMGGYCTVLFSGLPQEADENALYSLVKAH